MNETPSRTVDDQLNPSSSLHKWLDGLTRGECTRDEFLDALFACIRSAPQSAPQIVALIDERRRQGELSPELFRSIAAKITGGKVTRAGGMDPASRTLVEAFDVSQQLAQPAILSGRVLKDRYVLEKQLGCGGRGTVFKALDLYRADLPPANRHIAVKIIDAIATDRAQLLADLRREFYCVQTLSHHNILKMYELDRDGDIDFLTMELLEGELLSSVMERFSPLPLPRPYAWSVIREIGSALAHAHARNVVHADLKPHNIMITDSGEIRILGFGSSSQHRSNRGAATTRAYSSCEVLAGRSADTSDDIYSLACLAYELIAGRHPFQRRPSTEARNLGITPARPPRLSRQQWQTIAMGLSWHRAGRSISVRSWLGKLHKDNVDVKELPPVGYLRPMLANPAPRSNQYLNRLSAAVVLLAIAGVISIRLAPGGKLTAGDVVATVTAKEQDSTPGHAALQDAPPPTAKAHPPVSNKPQQDAGRLNPRSVPRTPGLIAADRYSIRSGEHFAEIRVHRAAPARGATTFVWWTEPASAKPGVDYVHQEKVLQSIPTGKRSASFFIKLVPEATRAKREVFYVAIAEAGHGTASGPVARAAIWLPAKQDPS